MGNREVDGGYYPTCLPSLGESCGHCHRCTPPAPDAAGIEAARRAKVNGSPHGTIAWSEHERAWKVYARHHQGQSAERINERGGFGIAELTHQLGHPPLTWEPDERTRFMDGAAPRGMAAALLPVVTQAQAEAWDAGYEAAEYMAHRWGHVDYWEDEPTNPYPARADESGGAS